MAELISMLCKLSMTRISPRGYNYTGSLHPKEVPFSSLKLINERVGPEICHYSLFYTTYNEKKT